mmetsp:Transcript_22029/g.39069  ORF Transcript_22029/g.39069 Transcript_22029/m.39069 type:complete len:272 (+) Transcript_22029:18-833(+)
MGDKFAQIVIGPAGSGKSTYCTALQNHCLTVKRTVHVVNLDPAAENFKYKPAVDIRDLISLDDVMEEMDFGPNGGLLFCMEYLVENMDWLEEQIVGPYGADYLLIDCPGQIELYVHLPVLNRITKKLEQWGYRLCVVCLLDSIFITSPSRFISGTLTCLAAMMQLALPHINLLTKCDLLNDKKETLEKFFNPSMQELLADLNQSSAGKFQRLNEAMSELITSYSLTSYLPLDLTEKESLEVVLAHIDHAMQYGEGLEPKDIDERELNDEKL